MSPLSSISTSSAVSAPPKVVDPDHDGDNDKGVSAAKEASETSSFGPATKITLSAAAQAQMASG